MARVSDSETYRHAVDRLKRLLQDPSPSFPLSSDYDQHHSLPSSHYPADNRHRSRDHSLGGHKLADRSYSEGWRDRAPPLNVRMRSRMDCYPSRSGDFDHDLDVAAILGVEEGRWTRGLLELVKRQEELITQLEKENQYLKNELVIIGESLKNTSEDNQVLRKQLTDSLRSAIIQTCDNTSICDDKLQDSLLACLKEEKSKLESMVNIQEKVILDLQKRESNALDKLQNALVIAEETQTSIHQVKDAGEAARKALDEELAVTQRENKQIVYQLQETRQQLQQLHMLHEQQEARHLIQLQKLEEEQTDLAQNKSSVQQRCKEAEHTITDLQNQLKNRDVEIARLKSDLEEERALANESHSRLDNLLQKRENEVELASARAQDLESRLRISREDANKLLDTVTGLAKSLTGGSHSDKLDIASTDDDKSAQQTADLHLSAALSALQARHEAEVQEVQIVVDQQNSALESLKDELKLLRTEFTQANDEQRRLITIKSNEIIRVGSELSSANNQIKHFREQLRIRGSEYQKLLDQYNEAQSLYSSYKDQMR